MLVCGFGFYGGILYQKSKTPVNTASADSSLPSGSQNFSGPRRMTLSEVTAVSSTSIAVTTDGTNKTYTINADTVIQKDGSSATTNDIAVGDRVLIIASSSDSSIARRIDINPTFGNGPMMQYNDGDGNTQIN